MPEATESRLGIADATADLHEVIDICKAADLAVLPEDGSGTAAYAFSISSSDWARARNIISASHRFRSGDLHVFLFDRAIPRGQRMTKEVQSDCSSWRKSLRRQDTLKERSASEPEFDDFIETRTARQVKGKNRK